MNYTIHDLDSAPETSRPILQGLQKALHMIPNLSGTMAGSPQLLSAFTELTKISSTLTLNAMERETAAMAIGVEVGCSHCIAFHTMTLQRLRAPEALVRGLKTGGPLPDARLSVLRDFARAVVRERGQVDPALQQQFSDAGFTPQQGLEVIFLVGMLTLSMYTSRLANVPLDEAFVALAS